MAEKLPRPATGFRVKAELRMTPDKGIGVFAAEFIPANTRVNNDYHTTTYNKEEVVTYLASLSSDEERKRWLEHAYGRNERVVIEHEDIRMLNHSNNPTLVENPDNGHDYTTRDVYEGEELTEDYRKYGNEPLYMELCKQYGVSFWYINDS